LTVFLSNIKLKYNHFKFNYYKLEFIFIIEGGQKKVKILIIEDIDILSDLFKQMIKFYNPDIEVEIAETAEKALRLLENNNYDLVFLDVILPDEKGTEVLKYIKEKYPHTKVIAITGATDEDLLKELENLGCDDVLIKPVKTEELLNILKKYI